MGKGEPTARAALCFGLVNPKLMSCPKMVTNMYPGYSGARPKMQIYHGSADTTLAPANYNETIKEWCGVFQVGSSETT